MDVIIRKENKSDIEAISEVTIAGFKNHPIIHETEQFIILALRNAKAQIISLVAEIDGQVAGYIAFSPVKILMAVLAGMVSDLSRYCRISKNRASKNPWSM